MSRIHFIFLCLGLIIAFLAPQGAPSASAQEEENEEFVEVKAGTDADEPEPVREEDKEDIVVVAGDDFFDDFDHHHGGGDDDDHGLSIALSEGSGIKLLTAIVICSIIFFSPAIFLGVILYYFYRRRKLSHETAYLLAEKGLEIPPALLRPENKDLRNGILLITGGIGISSFFLAVADGMWGLGLFPLFLGVGYLIVWKLGNKNKTGIANEADIRNL